MFDKLIASDAVGADFKNRRNYFMVSSLVVGVLFLAAVVLSIFASDYALGTNVIELTELLPPAEMAANEPDPPQPKQPQTQSQSKSDLPTRQVNMSRVDEPTIVPTTISSIANTQLARPEVGRYRIANFDSEPAGNPGNGSGRDSNGSGSAGTGLYTEPQSVENSKDTDPPPIKVPPAVKKDVIRSIGVANGKATYLPKPPYPPAAMAVNAQGAVDVQVTIDETGRVVSAKAVSGNALLRFGAEQAARNARFSPTLLSNVPVKVTGVIVYNFIK